MLVAPTIKYSTCVTLRRTAALPTWLVNRASLRAHQLLARRFAEAGARGYHFRLLAALEALAPTSQAALGRHTEIDRSDVVSSLDELGERGFVRREPDPADRRRNLVTLTDAGQAELARLGAVVEDVQAEFTSPLTAAERRDLVRLLEKLG